MNISRFVFSVAAMAAVTLTLPPATSQEANSEPAVPRPVPAARTKPAAAVRDYNGMILEAIKHMPAGGGYSANAAATGKLVEAATFRGDKDGGLGIKPEVAQPSYCSGATYLVFLKVIDQLVQEKQLPLTPEVLKMLEVRRQADGTGVWGRWNANGPGTARFFYEAGLGGSAPSLDRARPGDFLKIWWNEHVGKRERGHSVIFLGFAETPEGEEGVKFWSSNEPDGFGEKVVPLTKVKRALITRLEHPEALTRLTSLAPRDAFLARMLEKDCPEDEYLRSFGYRTGTRGPAGKETSALASDKESKVEIVIEPETATSAAPTAPAAVPASSPDEAIDTLFAGTPYAGFSPRSRTGIFGLLQSRLAYEGFLPVSAKSRPASEVVLALKAWQARHQFDQTGRLDERSLPVLGLAGLPEMAPATPSEKERAPAPAGKPKQARSGKKTP